MDLKSAMQKIENDSELTARFQNDPKAILEEMGVDTTNCKIVDPAEDGITQLSDQELESVAGGTSVSACVVVGVSEDINFAAESVS